MSCLRELPTFCRKTDYTSLLFIKWLHVKLYTNFVNIKIYLVPFFSQLDYMFKEKKHAQNSKVHLKDIAINWLSTYSFPCNEKYRHTWLLVYWTINSEKTIKGTLEINIAVGTLYRPRLCISISQWLHDCFNGVKRHFSNSTIFFISVSCIGCTNCKERAIDLRHEMIGSCFIKEL